MKAQLLASLSDDTLEASLSGDREQLIKVIRSSTAQLTYFGGPFSFAALQQALRPVWEDLGVADSVGTGSAKAAQSKDADADLTRENAIRIMCDFLEIAHQQLDTVEDRTFQLIAMQEQMKEQMRMHFQREAKGN